MRRAILKFKRRFGAVFVLSCAFAACTSRQPAEVAGSRVVAEKPAPGGLGDFTLLDHKGEVHSLYREADAKAIVIIAAVVAIVFIALKAMGLSLPTWAVQMLVIVLVAFCALVAIAVVASL